MTPDTTKSPIKILSDAMWLCRGAFIFVLLFSMGVNVLMLTAPVYMMQVFDRVLSSRSVETLLTLLVMAGLALLVLALLDGARGVVLSRIGAWLDARVAPVTFSGVILNGMRGHASAQALRDLATFRGFIAGPAVFPILDAPWMPLFLGVLFILHPVLGGIATVGGILLFMLAVANEMLTRTTLRQAGEAAVKANQTVEAAARNADVIQAMGMMEAVENQWRPLNEDAGRLNAIAGSRGTMISTASKFLRFCLQIAVLSFGAWLVLQEQLTPGAMIAASIIMGRALSPVEQAIGSWKQGIAARDAYRRLKVHLTESPAPQSSMPLPAPDGVLRVHGLGYFHEGFDHPALNAVSFDIEPGDSVGIAGPSASGKSTLARALIGNLKPKVGHVRLDGMEVSEWDKADLGRHIGYMPQDVQLFPGTIAQNIARLTDPSPEAVVQAARDAGAHEKILALPGGYEYRVTENGIGLSGGQKQAVALARALYGNPRLVVLDEPNANVDSTGEDGLAQALAALKAKAVTTVVVSHRAHAMRNVDKMLLMKGGQVARFGDRDEVLAQIMPFRAVPQRVSKPAPSSDTPAKPKPKPKSKSSSKPKRRRTPALAKG